MSVTVYVITQRCDLCCGRGARSPVSVSLPLLFYFSRCFFHSRRFSFRGPWKRVWPHVLTKRSVCTSREHLITIPHGNPLFIAPTARLTQCILWVCRHGLRRDLLAAAHFWNVSENLNAAFCISQIDPNMFRTLSGAGSWSHRNGVCDPGTWIAFSCGAGNGCKLNCVAEDAAWLKWTAVKSHTCAVVEYMQISFNGLWACLCFV